MEMKIKHIRCLAALAAALPLAGNVAMADPIIPSSGSMVGEPGSYQYSDGGEFLVTVNNNPSLAFNTFCIETQHEFHYGDTETYTLGQTTHGAPPTGASTGF